jgi:hypothetical protein
MEVLLNLLNENKHVEWLDEEEFDTVNTEFPYDNNDVDEYIRTTFPISAWSYIEYIDGVLHFPIDMAGSMLEAIQSEFNIEHDFTFTQFRSLVSLFNPNNSDEVKFEITEKSVNIMSVIEGVVELLPPELVDVIKISGDEIRVPLLYIPLFSDYYNQIYPLYYPTETIRGKKARKMIRGILDDIKRKLKLSFRMPSLSSDPSIYKIRSQPATRNAVYNALINIFGKENIEIIGNFINIHSSEIYDRMWKEHITELLNSESRYQLLMDRLQSSKLVDLLEELIIEGPSIERLQNIEELSNFLEEWEADLNQEIFEYTIQIVRPPTGLLPDEL